MTSAPVLVVSATAVEAAHVPARFGVLHTGIGMVDAGVLTRGERKAYHNEISRGTD